MNFFFPCDSSAPITQRFGENPASYRRFNLAGHNGLDFALPLGSPVYAAAPGTIDRVSIDPAGYGQYIKIRHAVGAQQAVPAPFYTTLYGHLSKPLVTDGDIVQPGQQIALSGNTGNSTGPHLHFEIRQTGQTNNSYNTAIDPYPLLSPSIPVGAQHAVPSPLPTQTLHLVINPVNVRTAPNTKAPIVCTLPRNLVIATYGTTKNPYETWVTLAPNLYCALKYKSSTYLEPIS